MAAVIFYSLLVILLQFVVVYIGCRYKAVGLIAVLVSMFGLIITSQVRIWDWFQYAKYYSVFIPLLLVAYLNLRLAQGCKISRCWAWLLPLILFMNILEATILAIQYARHDFMLLTNAVTIFIVACLVPRPSQWNIPNSYHIVGFKNDQAWVLAYTVCLSCFYISSHYFVSLFVIVSATIIPQIIVWYRDDSTLWILARAYSLWLTINFLVYCGEINQQYLQVSAATKLYITDSYAIQTSLFTVNLLALAYLLWSRDKKRRACSSV